jgi:hypothetical protein
MSLPLKSLGEYIINSNQVKRFDDFERLNNGPIRWGKPVGILPIPSHNFLNCYGLWSFGPAQKKNPGAGGDYRHGNIFK